MRAVESMRRDWDERARKDAFYYIASWQKDWDLQAFFKSGEDDYNRLVAPLFQRTSFLPQGKTAIELGCGAGRMTRAFAAHFSHVAAFDISEEMLKKAKALLPECGNVTWLHSNGGDLREADGESVDFVFSYLVLQHLPQEELVRAYIREMLRVLRRDGLCLFQFNGSKRPTMNWKGHMAWKVIDSLWAMRLRGVSRSLAKLAGFDPEMAGNSWHGTSIAAARVAETVRSAGGAVIEMIGENTAMAWCSARKTDSAALAGTQT
ncbi:MAG: methyltransferase domain-containing protein [Candidatus Acidiferrales bacterium]